MKKTSTSVFLCLIMLFNFIPVSTIIAKDIESFPIYYDLREEQRLTPVKNQGSIGSCWALSMTASLESSLKTIEKKDYDLSENNMIAQLSNAYNIGTNRAPENGGDDALATAYYASWSGPVLETDDPYPTSMQAKDIRINAGLNPIKHIQEVIFLPKRKNPLDNDLIKEHIMKYGAISATMWKGSTQTFGPFYNEETFSWYYPHHYMNNDGNGHAINIVGWDDSYSKDNFKITPPGDGAFIVRNTKGAEWGRPNRKNGMGGYFYISYYDGMMGTKLDGNVGSAVVTRIDETSNYSNIYQYDWLGYTAKHKTKTSGNVSWFANVFNILNPETEKLAAVSFYTLEENIDYEIWIANDYTSTQSLSSMEKLKIGNIRLPGYHTIDLNKEIPLDSGDKIAVAIKLSSKSFKPSIALESRKSPLSSKVTANKNESYIVQYNPNQWVDLQTFDAGANACVKIFTNVDKTKLNTLSYEVMKKDVDYVINRLKQFQPDAKISFTNNQLNIIDEVYEAIKTPMTKVAFYLLTNRLFTMMRDGHTHLNPNRIMFNNSLNLPFVWLQEGLVVNQSTNYFVKGDRIISIGGKTPYQLEKMLYDQIAAENKYWIHQNAHLYLNSPTYLDYFGLLNDNNTIDIGIKRDDKIVIIKKPIEKYKGFASTTNSWFEWHVEKENNLGYLRFDEFPMDKSKLNTLMIEVDAFFKAVAESEIQNIAIDLRNNPGGTAQILNHILSYIQTDKVYIDQYREYYLLPKAHDQYLFKDKVYVLISNQTFSCAVLATTIFKDNNIATVIGEPSGEKPAFNRHGNGADGYLPENEWKFMMTIHKSHRPRNNDDTAPSIFPDIPINTTREDILLDRDIQLETLRLITSQKDNTNYLDTPFIWNLDDSWNIITAKNFSLDEKNQKILVPNNLSHITDVYVSNTANTKKYPLSIKHNGESITMEAGTNLKKGISYHLNIEINGHLYKIIFTVEKEINVNPNFRLKTVNNTDIYGKFNYLCIAFTKDIKYITLKNIVLTDSNGKKIPIIKATPGDSAKNNIIMIPNQKLKHNETYTLHIEKDTFISVDNEKYGADIQITFINK